MNRLANSIWFWRIMFFVMAALAAVIYVTNPRVERETIYIIIDPESDLSPLESKFI